MHKGIVILGCGLSGMLTALAFANKNIKTTILEYQAITANNLYADIRTTALTPVSVNFLNNINIWDKIKNLAGKMLDIYVVDNKAPEMLWLKDIHHNDPLGYIISNSDLKRILLAEVTNNPLIEIIDQFDYKAIESENDYTMIHSLNHDPTIKSDLLIVCDGFNSRVRSYYFTNEVEKTYNQIALVFNIRHTKNHENCAVEHFMPQGPFAVLPIQDQYCSSIIWTVAQELAPLLLNLPIAEIEYLLNNNCGNSLGIVKIDSQISSFPLKARLTQKYFYNKIVLVADSAHIIHPLAGQGLNQGVQDIATLSSLIHAQGINNETLALYQQARKADNFAMYMITDNLNNIFSNHSQILWYLRRGGLKAIDHMQFVKDLILQYAVGYR